MLEMISTRQKNLPSTTNPVRQGFSEAISSEEWPKWSCLPAGQRQQPLESSRSKTTKIKQIIDLLLQIYPT